MALNFLFSGRSETDDDNGSLYDPKGRYFDLNKLKETHPHLKTLLSVGGANAGSGKFKEIVKTENNMRTFSRNAIIYMRDRHFDGIDIDWEWPSVIGAKKSFTQLLQVILIEAESYVWAVWCSICQYTVINQMYNKLILI